jgi:hypothetical protein
VNGPDKILPFSGTKPPGVNAGPSTAFGGKTRERAYFLRLQHRQRILPHTIGDGTKVSRTITTTGLILLLNRSGAPVGYAMAGTSSDVVL